MNFGGTLALIAQNEMLAAAQSDQTNNKQTSHKGFGNLGEFISSFPKSLCK
jgi:hypothetical protein